jgi:hypothetical protein
VQFKSVPTARGRAENREQGVLERERERERERDKRQGVREERKKHSEIWHTDY